MSTVRPIPDAALSAWEKVQFDETLEERSHRESSQDVVKRKKLLEHLIEKRIKNFDYIKKLHRGGTFFLNSVLVTSEEVYSVARQTDMAQRARMFYYLGISLSGILDLNNGPNTVRALSQLLEEWEYTFDSAPPIQGMKYMMATTTNTAYPEFLPFQADGDQLRSSLFRFKDDIVFEYLMLPHLPFVPDYVEVMCSLCDMLSILYENLMHKDTYSNIVLYDAVVRLDTRIKHYVVSAVAKSYTTHCVKAVHQEVSSLRGLMRGESVERNANDS